MTSTLNFDWDAVYRSAVAQLSPELQSRASADHSGVDSNGKWRIRDQRGAILGHATPTRTPAVRGQPSMAVDGESFVEFGREIGRLIREVKQDLIKRIEEIERRAAGRGVKWCGGWDSGVRYDTGDMTVFKGSLWICCTADCDSMPGSDHFWQRMLKADRRGCFVEGDRDGND